MNTKTHSDARKIAELSRIGLTEKERARTEREIPEILALSASLADGAAESDPFAGACPLGELREDKPVRAIPGEVLRAVSKKERDGYLHVVRVVG